MAASLNGRVLAFVEARMPDEMASLVRRHGGVPYSAPVMQEIYLRDDPEVRQLVSDICGGRIDIVVLLTGVGTGPWWKPPHLWSGRKNSSGRWTA